MYPGQGKIFRILCPGRVLRVDGGAVRGDARRLVRCMDGVVYVRLVRRLWFLSRWSSEESPEGGKR